MQALSITDTLAAISGPRLGSYRAFFSPASDQEVYGIYCWNEAVSSCFTALLNNLEVTLRNAFHRELSLRFGGAHSTTSSDWYNRLNLVPKSWDKIRVITHRRIHQNWVPKVPLPSPDDVVSGLTFGFWRHLLDVTLTTTGSPVDWQVILGSLLPDHPSSHVPGYWRRKRQDMFFARMDLVADVRNRIAHLEPLWKTGPLLEERRPRPHQSPISIVQPAPQSPPEALARLRLLHNRAFELLHWISSHRAIDHKATETYARFLNLTSTAGLDSYRALTADREITLLGLRRMVRARQPNTDILRLTKNGKVVAVIIPVIV